MLALLRHSALQLEYIPLEGSNLTLLCDTSTGKHRPIVPTDWRRPVFDAVHNLSHPSIRTTCKLMTSKFVWKGMAKQVRTWAKECLACQRSKIQRHTKAPLKEFAVPSRRFEHINIDLVGPLPPCRGMTHLLTIVDRFTRWPAAIPLSQTDSTSCARALIANWISQFGMPTDISSDRGPQFTSQLWTAISEQLGIQLHHTTSYHPQANGLLMIFYNNF
jgi:hypothetical protein